MRGEWVWEGLDEPEEGGAGGQGADSSDVRPLGIASVVRRLLERVVLQVVRKEFERVLAPFQFACGAASGAEMFTHFMRVVGDLHPEWSWLSLDLSNAFNCVSREAIVEALERHEGLRCLIPLFAMLYDEDGELWFWGDGTGVRRVIASPPRGSGTGWAFVHVLVRDCCGGGPQQDCERVPG